MIKFDLETVGLKLLGYLTLFYENSKILNFTEICRNFVYLLNIAEICLKLLNVAENKRKKFCNHLENIIFVIYSLDLTIVPVAAVHVTTIAFLLVPLYLQ